jgi:hypothetical protein
VTRSAIEIIPITGLELAFAPSPWEFARARRAEIDAHFAAARREKPALFNGEVLLLRDWAIDAGVLRGCFFATDFASMLAWKHFGCPETQATNCFAMGALRGTDNALLLGVMGSHTANAGQIYFPAGTPELSDVASDRVDLNASVWREVAEETGLTSHDLAGDPGWIAVRAGPRLALMKTMRAEVGAAALRARICAHLTAETSPELADIKIVRGPNDLDPAMPDFITAYLRHLWG